jgi:hypothetical protein
MSRYVFHSVLPLCLAIFSFTERITTDSYIGYAYEKGNIDPVYSETFTDKFINGRHVETETQYFDAAHKLIAQRSLDFSKSKFAPDFKTEDLRTGYLEGAEVTGTRAKLFVRKDKNSAVEEKTIDVPQPMIVDGGFNHFIKANWNKIEDGKPVAFYLTVSAKLDYYKLRVSKLEASGASLKVKIEPDQVVLRWIASPIVITYDISTKRIISYEGKSNITDNNGSNFNVRLIYPKKGP